MTNFIASGEVQAEQPPKEEADALETMMTQGIATLRAASTWMVGVFGAIGALLVAGLQLTDMGHLSPSGDDRKFWWAVGAFVVGFFATGVIIWMHANVIAPKPISLPGLVEMERKGKTPAKFVRDAGVLESFASIRAVSDELGAHHRRREEGERKKLFVLQDKAMT